MDRIALAAELARQAAAGRLPSRDAWTAVQRLLQPEVSERPVGDLVDALLEEEAPEVRALLEPLRQVRRKEILRARRLRALGQPLPADLRSVLSDLPLGALDGWSREPDALASLERAVALVGQIGFKRAAQAFAASTDLTDGLRLEALEALGADGEALAACRARLQTRRDEARAAALAALEPGAELPVELDEDVLFDRLPAAFESAPTRDGKRALLDLACCWPTDAAAAAIAAVAQEPWARERASLILLLRFGESALGEWDAWLRSRAELRARRRSALRTAVLRAPAEALYVDVAGSGDDPALEAALAARAGLARPALPKKPAISESPAPPPSPRPQPRPPAPPPPVRPVPPPEPSLWEAHVRPFLAGNGYLVAGVAMVVVGSSLLAYYTWDKHWLLRYTLMPALLGTFTAALAAAGSWIERRNPQLRPTAAVLRGAAVGLLPVNFMAVALLARDPQVTARGPAVVLLGTLYLLLAGWGLRRWCAAVHPSLGGLLGGALLGLNALVMVAPAALALAPATAVRLPVVAAV
ncbi:MAG TPA: hypothetical protein VEJ18_18570, partial [Planctomycetota bacterium]|nr:hypothetical protein [Planctomycetota bacterium]